MSALLEFIRFCEMTNWSVKTNLSSQINSKYKIVTLGKYIKEEKDKIKPFLEPNEDFKILGVNNKIGLFDNEIKKGKEINQAYKKVENGYLAYNPYRINVGSIGLKTQKQEFNLISPAYVVFSCSKILLPEYLYMLFKTNIFNNIIKESTRGSVRQILAYDILETLKIPLPDIETQKKIVQNYQEKLELAEKQEKEIEEKEIEIEKYLYNELDINIVPKDSTKRTLDFIRYKNLKNWEVSKQNNIEFTSKYNLTTLDMCCNNFKNGVNFNKSQFGKGEKFINIKDIYSEKYIDLEVLDRIEIDKSKLESNLVQNNDLVFVRSSVKYEGVGFPSLIKLNNNNEKITFCGFVIKCSININIINPSFLLYVLRSSLFRNIVIEKSNKSTITNISQPALKSLNIPLPPLKIQNELVNNFEEQQNKIQKLKKQSIINKTLALQEFEKEVFDAT